MSAILKLYVTPEEYLAREELAEEKSEYFDGQIFAMAGASLPHNGIAFNTGVALGPLLRRSGCRGFTSDMRVHVEATGLYAYPDLSVVCGEPRLDERRPPSLLNPTLLIEVLSPSTEENDRSWKSEHYRQLPSLQGYLLIAQDRPHVDVFLRQADGSWRESAITGLQGVASLPVLGGEIALADLYYGVEWEE